MGTVLDSTRPWPSQCCNPSPETQPRGVDSIMSNQGCPGLELFECLFDQTGTASGGKLQLDVKATATVLATCAALFPQGLNSTTRSNLRAGCFEEYDNVSFLVSGFRIPVSFSDLIQ